MNIEATVDRRTVPASSPLQPVTDCLRDGDPCPHDGDLTQMPVEELAALSRQQMDRYLSQVPSEDMYAFELFRRAICERDERAWSCLYAQYHLLLLGWLRRHPARSASREDDEELINRAFGRFWECVGPARFPDFPSAAALLRYLKLCVHSVVLDDARAHQHDDRESRDMETDERMTAPDPTAAIAESDAAARLWDAIAAEVRGEAELLVARLCFLHGMRPREVFERHPEVYESVDAVYRVKRNLLDRLKRNRTVRAFVEEA